MPKICGEVALHCSKEKAYHEISSVDFGERMGLAFGSPKKEILFLNERVLRTITKIENVGTVDMERIYIPECFTIVSQRKPPMVPFSFFLGLQILCEHEDGALLKWVEEFELDDENKPKEEGMLSGLRKHEELQFLKIQEYLNKL